MTARHARVAFRLSVALGIAYLAVALIAVTVDAAVGATIGSGASFLDRVAADAGGYLAWPAFPAKLALPLYGIFAAAMYIAYRRLP